MYAVMRPSGAQPCSCGVAFIMLHERVVVVFGVSTVHAAYASELVDREATHGRGLVRLIGPHTVEVGQDLERACHGATGAERTSAGVGVLPCASGRDRRRRRASLRPRGRRPRAARPGPAAPAERRGVARARRRRIGRACDRVARRPRCAGDRLRGGARARGRGTRLLRRSGGAARADRGGAAIDSHARGRPR